MLQMQTPLGYNVEAALAALIDSTAKLDRLVADVQAARKGGKR